MRPVLPYRDHCVEDSRLTTLTTVAQQLNEMQMVREKVYAMEQSHLALKQKSAFSVSLMRLD